MADYNTAAIFLIPSKRLTKDLLRLATNISYCAFGFMETVGSYLDLTYPNTCCHNVLLLTMILTSAFMYFCSIGVFCPCAFTAAVAIK